MRQSVQCYYYISRHFSLLHTHLYVAVYLKGLRFCAGDLETTDSSKLYHETESISILAVRRPSLEESLASSHFHHYGALDVSRVGVIIFYEAINLWFLC